MLSLLGTACLRRSRSRLSCCACVIATNDTCLTHAPPLLWGDVRRGEDDANLPPRRHIGSFPGLNIQGFFQESASERLQKHTEKKITPVPPDVFFEVVSDVDQYHKFLPFCVHSKVIRRLSDRVIVAEMGIGFRVFEERYVSHVTLDKEKRKIRITAIESPTFSKLNSFWEFSEVPGKPGHTHVNFGVEFGFSSPMMSQAIHMVINDVSKLQVKAFEARCLKKIAKESEAAVCAAVESSGPAAVDEEGLRKDEHGVEVRLSKGEKEAVSTDGTREAELSAIASELSRSVSIGRGGVEDAVVAALLLNHDGCMVEACMRLAKHQPVLSCSRGFALLAADSELRGAVTVGLHWLLLREKTLNGQSRVETLARALRLLLMKRDPCDSRAELMFFMADMNCNGAISKEELRCMLESHIRIVDAAVPWMVEKSLGRSSSSSSSSSAGTGAAAAAAAPDPEQLGRLTQHVLAKMKLEITSDVPAAVDKIFAEFDGNGDSALELHEWQAACRRHPELIDLLNLDGMSQMVHLATSTPAAVAEQGGGGGSRSSAQHQQVYNR